MRKRLALGIAVSPASLVLATTAPAHAAPRLRLYRGRTLFQEHRISFVVAKTDSGRFVREMIERD